MSAKRNLYMPVAAALCLAASLAYAHGVSAQRFVTKASVANRFEIESSQLALEKSKNDDVKDFAQHMVDDHTKIGDQLKEALQSSKAHLAPATSLDARHRQLMGELKAAQDKNFDRQYIKIQTNAHKEAVSLFKDYSTNGKNKSLRDFAANTLPMLKEHLKRVEKLKSDR